MLFGIFEKMRTAIRNRVERNQPGLYVYLIFPIAFAFLLTFIGSRIFSHLAPGFYFFEVEPGLRVHHFIYGIFVLAVSGYLALIFDGPRSKYFISLLHGFGLGLAFDEFGMWLRLRDDDPARWSYDGLTVIIGLFFLILSARPSIRMIKTLWPFKGSPNSSKFKA